PCTILSGPQGSGEPVGTYPPLRVGVRPKSVQSPTDISSELSTVTTAARASPHLDLTMSILPGRQRRHLRAAFTPDPDPPGALLDLSPRSRVCLTSEEAEAPSLIQEKNSHTYFPVSEKWCVLGALTQEGSFPEKPEKAQNHPSPRLHQRRKPWCL
uniref:Uncharacterized protein n=1 Tax=Neovison vison TaxID=452646 RepID=A0A8C7C8F4_NEOVI